MNNLLQLCEKDTIKNRVDFVAPMYIPEVWYRVEHLITKGLSRGEDVLTPQEIYHRLAIGEMTLWTIQQGNVLKAIALTEVGRFYDGDVCFIYLVSGINLHTWMSDLHDAIYQWAKENGCRKVKALGRPGWKKFYKQQGWRIESYEYSIAVQDILH
jgi:hypothetical protein